jgi:hypothetical protein
MGTKTKKKIGGTGVEKKKKITVFFFFFFLELGGPCPSQSPQIHLSTHPIRWIYGAMACIFLYFH